MNDKTNEQSAKAFAAARGSEISPAVGEACARLLMADSRLMEIVDSYPNGRLILSALYGRLGYKYANHDAARRDLIAALEREPMAGKSPSAADQRPGHTGGSDCK